MNLDALATLSLSLYLVIAALDGIWLHLVRLRLHTHQETYEEHILHTIRAVLMIPVMALLFVWETSGWMLWVGAGLAVVDFAVGFWDTWLEKDARATLGGMTRGESMAHIAASAIHGVSIALILVARPVEMWGLGGHGVGYLPWGEFVAQWLFPGTVLGALLHVVLCHPRWRRDASSEEMRWMES